MGVGDWLEEYGPGIAFGPLGDLAAGGHGMDWLNQRGPGQTSNVPGLDRGNFNMPHADDLYNRENANGHALAMRDAPQASNESAFRGDQTALVDRLRRQMDGEDSLSQLQLRDATDANVAQQQSMAAGASPGSAAMARRLAMQNTGKIGQGYGAQAAALGIQERNAAANALGSVAGMARGQDQQNNQFNVGAQLQQTGLNDAAQQHTYDRQLQGVGMQQTGSMGYEQQQTQRRGQDLAQPLQPTNLDRLTGAAGAVAPYAMMASDARLKTNIHPAAAETDTLIARLRPTEYEYRDPRLGAGPRVGVIAQDVEQGGPAGRALVSEAGPGGAKVLDVPKSLGAALAAIGRLGERVAQVEGRGAPMTALDRLGGLAARTKSSSSERAPAPPAPKVAAKRRGILPGELAKDASSMAEKGR